MPRLEVTSKTIKELYARSGNQCAFRGCDQEFFLDGNTENASEICHIEAAEKGGQRFNQESDDEYRRSYENLILLCPTHHKVTDDVTSYSVDMLRKIKTEHQIKVAQKMVVNNPKILLDAINAIAETDFDNKNSEENQENFSIQAKMNHNSVKRWEPIITEYKVYQSKIDSLYNQLEQSGESFKKHKLLSIIQHTYLEILGEYKQETSQDSVQNNADNILDSVRDKLMTISNNHEDNRFIAIPIIMVDAFMRCKILERPPSQ